MVNNGKYVVAWRVIWSDIRRDFLSRSLLCTSIRATFTYE